MSEKFLSGAINSKQTNKTFKYVCLGTAQDKKIIFVVERRECHHITLMNLVGTNVALQSSFPAQVKRRKDQEGASFVKLA